MIGLFEKFVGKRIKCVHSDAGKEFALFGILKKEEGEFLFISTNDRDVMVRLENVQRVEEIPNDK